MKTIEEQISVMQHYANGGEVEYFSYMYNDWRLVQNPFWDWHNVDYRIKEQKKTVTIIKFISTKGKVLEMLKDNFTQYNKPLPNNIISEYEVEL